MGGASGSPLEGLRALELPGGVATRYCGRLLATLGAEVVRVGDRDDDAIGFAGAAGRAYGRWLDQGKGAETDVQGSFDLVLAGMDAAAVARADSVARGCEGAPVLVAIRWFAADGPYADWPATDEVVLAVGGLAHPFGDADGPPTLAQGHAPQLIAGANACGAALAALLAPRGSRPHRVDVDVLESAMCLSETGAAAAVANPRATSTRLGVNRFSPTYPCSSYRTSDGWVGVTCLTPAQWVALCDALERPDLAADPAYATAVRRLRAADEVDAALAPGIAARSTAAWVEEGARRRIPITPMPTPGALPSEEHWRLRGSFGPVGAGERTGDGVVLAPTLPFTARYDGAAVERWPPDPDVVGPLSGLRVVDFTMGWAGPLTTRVLGDLGADVVKVESATHPDWWRGWEAGTGADPPPIELQPHFNAMNRNKRGVALELRTGEGREAALALLASADVVVDNFAAGVLDSLGLGPDVQRRLHPGVISLSMPAFGSGGPLSALRAYGSTVEQASGLPFVNGRAEWPPCLQHVAFGDPIAGVYGALAVLAALHGRTHLGGADLELAQVACLFEMGADAVVAAQVDGSVARTGNRRARLAACFVVGTGDGGWLAVAADRAGIGPLRAVVGAERDAGEDAVEEAAAAWAAGQPADAAAAALRALGIAAAPVVPAHRLGADPHLRATGFWQELERPHVGRHVLGAPPYRLDGERPAPRRPAPTLGQHTDEVVAALAAGHA